MHLVLHRPFFPFFPFWTVGSTCRCALLYSSHLYVMRLLVLHCALPHLVTSSCLLMTSNLLTSIEKEKKNCLVLRDVLV